MKEGIRMNKRKVRGICRFLFAVGIIVKVVAIYALVFSGLGVVNGGRFLMLLPFGVSVAMLALADELLEATERRMK